jgi:hypothetical protein
VFIIRFMPLRITSPAVYLLGLVAAFFRPPPKVIVTARTLWLMLLSHKTKSVLRLDFSLCIEPVEFAERFLSQPSSKFPTTLSESIPDA